jgi:sterol desaturase/sphingolipid hydroxylase (fatty acid hydroxylase superfamily)
MFAINGVPVVILDALLGLRIASGMLVAFSVYFLTTEEFHWRIHLGESLPPGFRGARAYHLAHHARPDARFNIFLPLWDVMFRTAGR